MSGVGEAFLGPLEVLIVVANEASPVGFPPTLGTLSFPPCNSSYPIALDSTGADSLPLVLDTSATGRIVVETANTEVTTLVDSALVTVYDNVE
jgi:hypothetical protein